MASAIVAQWSGVRTGREQEALDLARQANELWDRLAAEGRCDKANWLLNSLGGLGIWFVTGAADSLQALAVNEEVQRIVFLSRQVLEDYRLWTTMVTGDEAAQTMQAWAAAVTGLGRT